MNIDVVREFLMWCTIINAGLLILTSLLFLAASDLIYSAHSKWFPLSREAFTVAIYGFIGFYKILIIVFNIVPFVAVSIVAT